MVKKEKFGEYEKYILSCGELAVSVITLGATVQDISYYNKPLILKYSSPEGYLKGESYVGATIGRFSNRIKNSRFTLEGKEYILPPNDSVHQIHGGPDAFDKKRWTAEILSDFSVKMSYFSPDGENGFPGNLTAWVIFTVDENSLKFNFGATADKATPYAPTTHMYFNLTGKKPVYETEIKINTPAYLECDADVVPTGKVLPATGDFDFSSRRKIRRTYDDSIILGGEDAVEAFGDEFAVSLKTDFPALVFYTWEFPEDREINEHGFTIEPHFYPDCVNHPEWPSVILKPGDTFDRYALYTFKKL